MFSLFISASLTALYWLFRVVPVVATGIFATSFAVNLGLMKKFSRLVEPLSSKAKISAVSALAVVTCTFSTTAGYSMLVDGLNKKVVSEQEVVATTLISSFPSILSHLFTFFIPVIIPILGLTTGAIYVCLVGLVALLKSCFGVFLARLWHSANPESSKSKLSNPQTPKPLTSNLKQEALNKSTRSTYKMLKRVVPTMFVTLFLVSVAEELGLFESFSAVLQPLTSVLGLESEVVLISATDVVNSYSGLILAGSLLEGGRVTTRGVLVALLLGNVVSFSARFAKHSLPLHFSLFGPRLGSRTVAVNAGTTLVLDAVFIVVLLMI
ncbi:MAG: hypothetical protein C4B55_03550 [Candidatus Methanophagaceae archaeon]|nr:MAG: hypothetical protein C4B55_03550 [Methanophagales archaeon]